MIDIHRVSVLARGSFFSEAREPLPKEIYQQVFDKINKRADDLSRLAKDRDYMNISFYLERAAKELGLDLADLKAMAKKLGKVALLTITFDKTKAGLDTRIIKAAAQSKVGNRDLIEGASKVTVGGIKAALDKQSFTLGRNQSCMVRSAEASPGIFVKEIRDVRLVRKLATPAGPTTAQFGVIIYQGTPGSRWLSLSAKSLKQAVEIVKQHAIDAEKAYTAPESD